MVDQGEVVRVDSFLNRNKGAVLKEEVRVLEADDAVVERPAAILPHVDVGRERIFLPRGHSLEHALPEECVLLVVVRVLPHFVLGKDVRFGGHFLLAEHAVPTQFLKTDDIVNAFLRDVNEISINFYTDRGCSVM